MGILDIIAGPVMKILDKVIPDPAAKAAAQLQILQLNQAGEFKQLEADLAVATAQTDTNKVEATNPSLFVSGWRPFVGWICGAGMASQFVIGPFVQWAATLLGHPTPWPQLDLSTMSTMLLGMLGLGGMRTFEKVSGVARS
jgi:hypothetical protein